MAVLHSLVLYIGCFLASAGLLHVGIKRSSKLLKLIAIFMPILLVGLRTDVGTDYQNYVQMFDKYSGMDFAELFASDSADSLEFGFFGLIKFASLLANEPWMMFLLSAVITIGFAYVAIRRLSPTNVPIAFLLYTLILIPFAMNGVRQGIAISIIFFAYSYIVRGNPMKYLLVVLVASSFHLSAIAMLPLYLLRFVVIKKRIDEPFTLVLSIAIAAIAALLIPVILIIVSTVPVLSNYANYESWDAGIGRSTIAIMAALSLIAIVTYKRMSINAPVMQLMAMLLFLEFSSLFLGNISAAFSRMSYYLTIGGLVYLANTPSIFTKGTSYGIQFLILAYGLWYFISTYYIAGYSDIFPYNGIWGGSL